MPKRDHDVYASEPMRGLLAEELAALTPFLQRCAGTRGALVSAWPSDVPPSLPLLGCWTQLTIAGQSLAGDVRASMHASLPFADGSFDLVLLRHALEVPSASPEWLAEVVRCLAPGGLLALTGVHPISGWLPWWHWRTRGTRSRLNSPLKIGGWLRRAELQVERVQRVGCPWPTSRVDASGVVGAMGGGYVMLARKRRAMSLPTRLRPRPRPVPAPTNAGLASSARRNPAA
ncbi:class I SAM-dependent methyltransferase [Dyella sp. A6]|uniref:class I SAM-dependent methyltransferase n=1 Tax=Dyella aluminiiresistens TaxID=3069105 RepID=UPI002E77D230|nr:methyltransferase domain-containing protein [Dyella sp. A6]